jgi:uncharacterized protein YhdP
LRGACRNHSGKATLVGLALLLALVLVCADTLLAGPMRSWTERTINSKLKGYTVHIARVRPHLWKMGFELDELVLAQNSHPDPPVADFGALVFSLQWGELLRFKVAGDLTLQRPALHLNLAQIEEEASSHVSLREQGWQSAVESIYPFKLDRVKVEDGSLLYLASAPTSKPLHLTKVFMVAKNIRNKAAGRVTYPSPVTLEGILFDSGKVWFSGAADFLREPYAAALGEIRLERIPLDRLTPFAQDYQLKTTGGFLSATGTVEYTPEAQKAHLTKVLFEDLRVDYVTSSATQALEKEHARQALELAKAVRNAPKLLLQVDSLKLSGSQIGFMNQTTQPPYRLFMSGVSLDLENLSNQANLGRSQFHARGAFMGSGRTEFSGSFRSTARPADFNLQLKLEDAKVSDLNDYLMANAKVDVAEGSLSAYAEITVKDGRLDGYLKPLLKGLRISDKRKDQAKPLGKRVELHVLQFFANLFKNRSSKEVATVIRLSGPTSDPKVSEWAAIRKLIGNGLYRAILPGFMDNPKGANPPKPASYPPSEPNWRH